MDTQKVFADGKRTKTKLNVVSLGSILEHSGRWNWKDCEGTFMELVPISAGKGEL